MDDAPASRRVPVITHRHVFTGTIPSYARKGAECGAFVLEQVKADYGGC